ncbi:MAG TPA: LapA family protein [Xanthomonadales bacterium]|nr:LapA family protein [Xanthomonadales bacterium]
MLSLIIAILFGLSITFFAFQNLAGVPIVIGNFFLPTVPVYLVVIVSLLVGILMAWFISAIEGMSHFMNIRRKDSVINNDKKEINALQRRINELEGKNAELKDDKSVVVENRHEMVEHEEPLARPSFFERLFPNSRRHYSKHV